MTPISKNDRCEVCNHSQAIYNPLENQIRWYCQKSQMGEKTCKLYKKGESHG